MKVFLKDLEYSIFVQHCTYDPALVFKSYHPNFQGTSQYKYACVLLKLYKYNI